MTVTDDISNTGFSASGQVGRNNEPVWSYNGLKGFSVNWIWISVSSVLFSVLVSVLGICYLLVLVNGFRFFSYFAILITVLVNLNNTGRTGWYLDSGMII